MLADELKVFICFFCEEHFNEKQHLTRHQDTCSMRSSGLQTLFTDSRLPQQQELRAPDHSRSAKRSFFEHFGVISVGRAESLCRRDRGEQVVCDVIVIDNSDDEDDTEIELQHDTRPMSPRSLIPPESNFKRNSSIERKNAVVLKRGGDTVAASHSAEKLLRIDVCSPLGQRLRDHLGTLSRSKSVPLDSEKKRPLSNKSSFRNCPSTSSFNDKLRLKDYQVTFRPSRQQRLYSHAYKFTNRQRKEFCRAFDCGLTIRARRLLRKMKPCRVQVPKLSSKSCCLNMPESELTPNQNRVHLQIRKSVGPLEKCDNRARESTLDADRNDLNGSEIVSYQVVSTSSFSIECGTQDTTAVSPTPENSQRYFDSESSAAGECATAVTADAISLEYSQQSIQVGSTLGAADNLSSDKSDSLLVSSEGVFKDISNTNSDDSSVYSTATDSPNCPELLATTAASSNAARNRSPSVNSVKVQTADKDCQTADCARDCGTEESREPKSNKSGWSMSDNLPALSFLCNICGDVVNCESHSKSLIFNHYASHGITNIDLLEETTASGEKVIKLIEIPVVKVNAAKTTQATSVSTVANQNSPNKSILVQPSCSGDAELGISNTVSATHAQNKRRRVTWADEVCSQLVPSPVCLDAAQQDAITVLSEQQLASCPSPETLLLNNGSNNDVIIPPASGALGAELSVTGSSLSSTAAAGDSISYSFPVSSSLNTVPNAIPCSNLVKKSSERGRSFWSNSSLERTTSFGNAFSVAGRRNPPRRPVSTALTTQKRLANDVLLTTSAPVGEEDGVCRSGKSLPLSACTSSGQPTPASDSSVSSRDNSYTPVMSKTRNIGPTLNTCRQSYQQETNVICID